MAASRTCPTKSRARSATSIWLRRFAASTCSPASRTNSTSRSPSRTYLASSSSCATSASSRASASMPRSNGRSASGRCSRKSFPYTGRGRQIQDSQGWRTTVYSAGQVWQGFRKGASMPSVGLQLKHARERLGLSAAQIEEQTKVQLQKIEALEDGNIAMLPGGIYLDGIIRAYAHEVGLDPEALIQQARDERATVVDDWETPFGDLDELFRTEEANEPRTPLAI